eukprot:gnl/MRDRNA2_/MRDRNA2_172866_c0_seq1.p1 gnl/MRDRNA2_/MRDRNA2_172866_c0~~gnl/MRDRNA2_/MRDRNA2_172866_c0_seq1.p1  ORF type:complete len:293 (-),score=32.93 gnl/MRDRNA2_/MRDRNA2_172866_c0_seq1:53-931(-)
MTTTLGEHELWLTLTQLDVFTLLQVATSCRQWQVLANHDALWKRQCAEAWSGKSYVPQRFVNPFGMAQKRVYFEAIRDSRRTNLSSEELCTFTWERTWTRAGRDEDDAEVDPRNLLGDIVEYTETHRKTLRLCRSERAELGEGTEDDHRYPDLEAAATGGSSADGVVGVATVHYGRMRVIAEGHAGLGPGSMRWCMTPRMDRRSGALVSYVANRPDDMNEDTDDDNSDDSEEDVFNGFYPAKAVRRTPQWGWTMQNDFAKYCMVGTTIAFRQDLEETLSKIPVREPAFNFRR